MKDTLATFVSILEKAQVTVKKNKSWAEWIIGWLKSLFRAIARIFATYCPPTSAFLHSVGRKAQAPALAASTLGKAAATFCAGAFLEHL